MSRLRKSVEWEVWEEQNNFVPLRLQPRFDSKAEAVRAYRGYVPAPATTTSSSASPGSRSGRRRSRGRESDEHL